METEKTTELEKIAQLRDIAKLKANTIKIKEIPEAIRQLIDIELTSIAAINAQYGIDTPQSEKTALKQQAKVHYENIEVLNKDFYKHISPDK